MALQLPQQRPAIRLEHLCCEQRQDTQHKAALDASTLRMDWRQPRLGMRCLSASIDTRCKLSPWTLHCKRLWLLRRLNVNLHDAILAAGHQQLAILPEAAAVGPVLEAGICPADLPRVAIIYDDL